MFFDTQSKIFIFILYIRVLFYGSKDPFYYTMLCSKKDICSLNHLILIFIRHWKIVLVANYTLQSLKFIMNIVIISCIYSHQILRVCYLQTKHIFNCLIKYNNKISYKIIKSIYPSLNNKIICFINDTLTFHKIKFG